MKCTVHILPLNTGPQQACLRRDCHTSLHLYNTGPFFKSNHRLSQRLLLSPILAKRTAGANREEGGGGGGEGGERMAQVIRDSGGGAGGKKGEGWGKEEGELLLVVFA